MFAVCPGKRTHKLQLLSFEDAVSNLPNPTPNQKKTTNRTKKNYFAASPITAVSKNKDSKSCSPSDLPKKTTPNDTTQTHIKDTASDEFESKKRVSCCSTSTAVEHYRVVQARQERKAARNSLLKLEEAADGRDNLQIFNELEGLCGGECGPLSEKLPYLEWRFGLKLKEEANYTDDENLDHSLSCKGFDSCSCNDAEQQIASCESSSCDDYEQMLLWDFSSCDGAEKQIPLCVCGKDKAAAALHCKRLMEWMPPSSPSHADELDDDDAEQQILDKEKAAAAALHYKKLMEWMPPSSPSHADELDDDWLFKTEQPSAKRQKKVCFLLQA